MIAPQVGLLTAAIAITYLCVTLATSLDRPIHEGFGLGLYAVLSAGGVVLVFVTGLRRSTPA